MLAPDLLAILVCPKSKEPLLYFPRGEDDRSEADAFLLCPASRLRYRIDDGVPVLLVDEARALSAEDTTALVKRAGALRLR